MKPWYEELFENYARRYDQECFTQGAVGEADFIEREIGGDKGCRILDVGCGTGRHAIELARRGYTVTGIDLSESMLARAREKASEAGAQVEFLHRDARDFLFSDPFGFALVACEGAFPLMATDEENFAILRNIHAAIGPGGKLVLTTLNALFPLFHSVKDFINQNSGGMAVSKENTFDLMTFRDRSNCELTDDSGKPLNLHCDERYYTPPEIRWLLHSLGFTGIGIYGCKLGAWSREDALTTEEYEMLVVANKP
jgi:2-polyprenyl-3-methyl-5-hydroxy-6-metoxy-1,4-benzoquinol methylase